jgi:hypothetical protein
VHRPLTPQQADVVSGRALAPPEDRHDEGEPDDHLGGGDDQREEVTKVRLTALSISSTHMNMISALRRTSRPMAPIQNIAAATAR